MNAVEQYRHIYAVQLRWLARTIAEILVVLWIGYFVAEYLRPGNSHWPPAVFAQGALLAVVFAGYVIGWRKEMIGGWMAILGTATFAAVLAITRNWPHQAFQVAWFAVPGVLYLMAQHYDRRAAEPSV
jgi:hypothetical protein